MIKDKALQHEYLGRGIVLGLSGDGKTAVQIFWIESRKVTNRRRLIVQDKTGDSVRVVCANETGARRRADLEYTAMLSRNHWHVVANGPQANSVMQMLRAGGALHGIGMVTRRSPPRDLLTPRITGVTAVRCGRAAYALCIAAPQDEPLAHESVRVYVFDQVPRGYGMCVTTYEGGGPRPIPYSGPPRLLSIPPLMSCVPNLWDILPKNLRVGVVAKYIDLGTGRSTIAFRSNLNHSNEEP